MKRAISAAIAVIVATTGASLTATAPAEAGQRVTKRLNRAIDELPVARETRGGYDRSKFRLWVDANHDCQDTRDEVLAQESLIHVTGCDIQIGKWRSYYDGVLTRHSTDFDIDHLVPLAEAWDSGAKRWDSGTRRRYANDLHDSRTLVAVTASANRSKSDRDPAEWMPSLGRCKYVRQWVAVKIRWHLQVDRTEKRALRDQASGCRNVKISVRRASIHLGPSSGSGSTSDGTSSGGGLDPRFDYCYQATAAGYGPYYQGQDTEYDWYTDADNDGVVCE